MQTVTVKSLRYDSAQGTYEARVDVERDGRTFRYPCRVEAPESAPRDWIEQALTRHALRQSDSGRDQPRLH
ncbi:orotidine 5'-phosphate decarboxylase [Rubellimicrobium arenae]|uniref:orotidine 5'-phosphate decarboxylase n=1 Tax=Rubellimicrobium arenae TaxID=2817372 RepID=UPI001B305C4E|nr:orotidine 5'-phosphate decarboxylase [Rubellimicrobium arenae]